ncbi:GntR family transcriptional regulator [Marinovum sp.]|uniref:GntR family transcriptional regulator n=1 Tax=Marinovum sp. TaxID=2024839 RepID=UPI002B26DCC8|nr:GntR family transcriptional regulator [Marinovum sp.]
MTDAATPKTGTLRNVAHERFMENLNAGVLKPAQLVTQRELCTLLDVPMGPMREALKRLEGEGIVTLIPQRGIRILDIDEKTINDAFRMRLMVEIEAVRAYADQADKSAAIELRSRTEAAANATVTTPEPLDLSEINARTALDHEMHRLFVNAMGNAFADELFDRILGRLQLSRLVFRLRNYTDDRAIREHLNILDFVIEGDPDSAGTAMETHLQASWRRALGVSR